MKYLTAFDYGTVSHAAQRPHAARVLLRRRRRRDRGRARRDVPGLDLQRPGPRPDLPRHRGRPAPLPLHQRQRTPAYHPLPRHPPGRHGRRLRDRRPQARASSTSSTPSRSACTSTTATSCRWPSTSPRGSMARSSSTRSRAGPKADHEFVMMMNGFDIDFDDANDFYAVNTAAFFYQNNPIAIKVGELVRIYLVNILEYDQINSFHLHANFFNYYPTGTRLDASEFTDTIAQMQGQRGILEFRYKFPGTLHVPRPQDRVRRAGLDRPLQGGAVGRARRARRSPRGRDCCPSPRRPPRIAGTAPGRADAADARAVDPAAAACWASSSPSSPSPAPASIWRPPAPDRVPGCRAHGHHAGGIRAACAQRRARTADARAGDRQRRLLAGHRRAGARP